MEWRIRFEDPVSELIDALVATLAGQWCCRVWVLAVRDHDASQTNANSSGLPSDTRDDSTDSTSPDQRE